MAGEEGEEVKEAEEILDRMTKALRRLSKFSTESERKKAEGKKALIVIREAGKAYSFQITGSVPEPVDDPKGANTVLIASLSKFLEYGRMIENGDTSAITRGVARGDLEFRGESPVHDRIMWTEALRRLARVAEVY